MRSLFPFLYLFLVGTKRIKASDPNLPFMEYLDQNHMVCLKWGFDTTQENITFKFIVNTTGWVGFGFSPNGGMAGADIVMGGLGASGSYFKDYYATGNTMPVVDKQQSYTLLSNLEKDGQTIMTFQRSIQSCDDQDFHITAQPIKLIYAYGQTDDITYHKANRGTKDVNLLKYQSKTPITDRNYFNVTMDNITVPANHTYYHCKIMKFPTLSTKHHIYLIEAVIEHHDFIHHMLLYRCPIYVTQAYDKQCYQGDVGDACFGMIAAWAVGGGIFEFEENTGIPVGGEDSDTFYRLEIHYNNPNKLAGKTDSSGLRLYYRPITQHQQYDVGILSIGLLPFPNIEYNIPPKAAQFRTYGVCNTSIISQVLNPMPDLHVFGVLLHTHVVGKKIRVGLYRNGEQIDFLALDENYNFDLQQIIRLGTIMTIKQGDDIVVECTYSTTSRTGFTKMGLATTEEMCLAFLLYYPAIKISSCYSHPNTTMINPTYQMLEGIAMSDQDEIAKYESLLKNVPQIQQVFDENFQFSFYTNGTVREMMKTPTVTCQSSATSALCNPWIVNPAGFFFLLLLCSAIM